MLCDSVEIQINMQLNVDISTYREVFRLFHLLKLVIWGLKLPQQTKKDHERTQKKKQNRGINKKKNFRKLRSFLENKVLSVFLLLCDMAWASIRQFLYAGQLLLYLLVEFELYNKLLLNYMDAP